MTGRANLRSYGYFTMNHPYMTFWGYSEVSRITLIYLSGPLFFLQVREREIHRGNDPSQNRVGQARSSDVSHKK